MFFNHFVNAYNTTPGENEKCTSKFEDTPEGYSSRKICIPSQESLALLASKTDHFWGDLREYGVVNELLWILEN